MTAKVLRFDCLPPCQRCGRPREKHPAFCFADDDGNSTAHDENGAPLGYLPAAAPRPSRETKSTLS